MTPLVWLLCALGMWVVLAVPVALLTGRVLRGPGRDGAARREPVGASRR